MNVINKGAIMAGVLLMHPDNETSMTQRLQSESGL